MICKSTFVLCNIASSLTLHDPSRYFTSFMDDPLFEKTEETGPYSEAQVILSQKPLTHLLLVRLPIKLVTMITSSLSAKKRSQKEDLTKSGLFTWFWCHVTWGIFIQSSTAEGNFPGVDKAAETWTWRADLGGGGGWRGQEGLGQRPHQAGIPLYTEVVGLKLALSGHVRSLDD